ncbi:FAD-dependent oxidoreductase [Marinobacterium rhizophilum]|uniref:FAD-dependent oxidoreductase n=1 Tax=Marinobacterium rhizophilum TaxID=420402 RepID=UPI00037FBA29|nr:FAD-dependent oxidoreductase [Marinobacterium rhizophilum]
MRASERQSRLGATAKRISFNGTPVQVVEGESIAAALVAAGHLAQRGGRQGAGHGHYCGMGACYECLVTVNGSSGHRACMTPVADGMVVSSQPYRSQVTTADETVAAMPSEALPEDEIDVLIIGAGPAGLQAALAAKRAGAVVLVVDERSKPGGQYFKQLSGSLEEPALDRQMLKGRQLTQKVLNAGVELHTGTLVWGAFREGDDSICIGVKGPQGVSLKKPRALVIATGATERPYPVPGWTLPGVMTTGGLQTLLRTYRTAPAGPIVIAGNGPLNLQVAAELVEAGFDVAAVVESGRPLSMSALRSSALAMARAPSLIFQGMGYLWRLRQAGVPIIYGHAVSRVLGGAQVESVELAAVAADGSLTAERRQLPARALGLGYGFLPQAEIARLLGVEHRWNDGDQGWISAVREDDGRCSVPGVFVAGEAGGFGGAHIAMAQGYLAGLAAAAHCGHRHGDPEQEYWRGYLRRHRNFQYRMWFAFKSALQPLAGVTPDTVICRCEDVTAAEIQACASPQADFGAVKRHTRAGMGRCQGRYCAASVQRLLAEEQQVCGELDLPAPQNPVKPLIAGSIAIEKGEWGGHLRVTPPSRRCSGANNETQIELRQAEVTVIGAGIAGVSTALFLARAGIDVVVVDRRAPNSEASGGNAGSLHVQLLSFDYGRKAEAGGGPAAQTLPLQQASAQLWASLAGELDCDIEFKRSGGLMVAETKQQLAFLEEKAALERSLGIDTQVIGAAEAFSLLPQLSPSVIGGAWCSEEGKINPLLATPALVAAAKAEGARFYIGESVQKVAPEGSGWRVETNCGSIKTGRVVNAAGAWAGGVGALAGIEVPVSGTPLQMIVTEATEPLVDVLLAHADRHLTLKQAANGNLIIGGGWPATASLPHGHPRPLLDSLEGNLWVARHVLPAVGRLRVLRSWAAMNVNIDGAPILGEVVGHPGFYNAVTSNGYTLGPMVGCITAELIQGRQPEWDLSPFSLERFVNP